MLLMSVLPMSVNMTNFSASALPSRNRRRLRSISAVLRLMLCDMGTKNSMPWGVVSINWRMRCRVLLMFCIASL